jgi:hypothetical protein
MSEPVTVCIPTRNVWDGIILTVESIHQRTRENVEILVCDNSLAPNARACEPARVVPEGADDGNRRLWLRVQRNMGRIQLIENIDQGRRYGHGENIHVMLRHVRTRYAMLFNSTSEILRSDWLDVLISTMKDSERDLGVARFRAGGAREHDYITPTYWPNMMMLDMRLYRRYFPGHTWELRQVGAEMFERPEIFYGQPPPTNPERKPPLVFCDTGWTLYEKLHFDNPAGLRMLPLPEDYWRKWICWMGGIDRNSFRPQISHVVETLAEIDKRLKALRAECNRSPSA